MKGQRIKLSGVAGLLTGEIYVLSAGSTVSVGRSRSCDLSLARSRAFHRIGRSTLERNRAFRRVSRCHFTVAFEASGRIVVRDRSTNGTRVDGSSVTEAILNFSDVDRRPVTIAFGDGERLVVSTTGEDVDAGYTPGPPETVLESHPSSVS